MKDTIFNFQYGVWTTGIGGGGGVGIEIKKPHTVKRGAFSGGAVRP
jgi:hypothetical protein